MADDTKTTERTVTTRKGKETKETKPAPAPQAPTLPPELNADIQAALTHLIEGQEELKARVEKLSGIVGALRVHAPAVPLTEAEVADAIKSNAMSEFDVLVDYIHAGHKLVAGRRMCAGHYPRIIDHVRNGLKLTAVH